VLSLETVASVPAQWIGNIFLTENATGSILKKYWSRRQIGLDQSFGV
jgi:hypothetical protein